ncbi:hypothetical protein GWQ44_26035 [Pseudomonas sp. 3MA1]|nr:hypothetical protein [Pseudomonas sp. 3MA1]
MLSAQQACALVLAMHDGIINDGKPERFVIQSCELCPLRAYWVIRCNSADYVQHGVESSCYIGINAHLVNVQTGVVDAIGSAISVDDYLQDKYDQDAAMGNFYVLTPEFNRHDKTAMGNLRQKLACTYPQVVALLSEQNKHWLAGSRRVLLLAQQQLCGQGVPSTIRLVPETAGAIPLDGQLCHADAVLLALRRRLQGPSADRRDTKGNLTCWQD